MEHYRTDPELFVDKANILKAVAHPQRLCIVRTLCEKENINVTDIQDCLDEAQSTVSQHLSKLKAARIIVGKREGTNIYYSFCNEKTKKMIQGIVKEVFQDNASE